MSDYPRPAKPGIDLRLYRPDVIVAVTCAVTMTGNIAIWLLDELRRPRSGARLQAWWWLYLLELTTLLFGLWVFSAFARRRLWGFVAVVVLSGLSSLGHGLRGEGIRLAVSFAFFLYAALRIFGFFGPRPLRRRDLSV